MKLKKYDYSQFHEAIAFLDSLPIEDESPSALHWCMHQIVWHKGVDRIRWLLENRDLVTRIASYSDIDFVCNQTELKEEFWQSVKALKDLNR